MASSTQPRAAARPRRWSNTPQREPPCRRSWSPTRSQRLQRSPPSGVAGCRPRSWPSQAPTARPPRGPWCRRSSPRPGAPAAPAATSTTKSACRCRCSPLDPSMDYAVLEMGEGRPGDIAEIARIARPDVAVVTNVGPAHLERLGSLEGAARTLAGAYEELAARRHRRGQRRRRFAAFFRAALGDASQLGFGIDSDATVRAHRPRSRRAQPLHPAHAGRQRRRRPAAAGPPQRHERTRRRGLRARAWHRSGLGGARAFGRARRGRTPDPPRRAARAGPCSMTPTTPTRLRPWPASPRSQRSAAMPGWRWAT